VKLPLHLYAVLTGLIAIALVFATNQIVPAANPYQAEMRIWLVGRATGIATLVLLTIVVVLGILLSHPEQAQWKQAKRLYPLHESVWVFTLGFLLVHIVSLAADRYAGVGWAGAIVPGLSSYRTPAVALGTLGAYALVITGVTARFSWLLPSGWWLKLHRLAVVVLGLGWIHGVLAGTDTPALEGLYAGLGIVVLGATAHRYWIVRRRAVRSARAATPMPTAPSSPNATVVAATMEATDA
jgi:sulfoxide reductase heme-binding subunit YedZ